VARLLASVGDEMTCLLDAMRQRRSLNASHGDKYYASVTAPPTIPAALEFAAQKYGLEVPLADLFFWGTDKAHLEDIQAAINVGPGSIDGVLCDHYAFRQEDVDWQLWIERRHWHELTPVQHQAFIPLFSTLLAEVHTQHIEKYGGKQKSVIFKDESLHADGTALVHMVIVDPRDPTINEDMGYRLQKHQDVWLVHDLLIDGSSIVTNFRTQFDQIIRQESYADLVRRLEQSPTSVDKPN
jgi:hypothetical protein